MRDIVEVLTSALSPVSNDDGMTVRELMRETGMGDTRVRNRLRDLMVQGKLIVGKRSVTDIAGHPQTVPVYQLIKEG